ncbi:MAG: hypothetical protein ACTHQE_16015 [Thermomicrobiales bacterium]
MTEIATSGWSRPEPESVLGFAVCFLLFTLAGYVVHSHIRMRRLDALKTGFVGLLFTIAILYGFAVGLWVVDRVGLYHPYATTPQWAVEREDADRVFLPNGAELEPTFAPEPTRPLGT